MQLFVTALNLYTYRDPVTSVTPVDKIYVITSLKKVYPTCA